MRKEHRISHQNKNDISKRLQFKTGGSASENVLKKAQLKASKGNAKLDESLVCVPDIGNVNKATRQCYARGGAQKQRLNQYY